MRGKPLLAAVLLLAIPVVALADEPAPGSSCSTANSVIFEPGAATSGVGYNMICTNGKWVSRETISTVGTIASAGGMQPGYDSRTCNTAAAGSISYNSSTNKITYCNGSAWSPFSTGCGAPIAYAADSAFSNPNYGTGGAITSDGTYFYMGDSSGSITALTFNTSTKKWTQVAQLRVDSNNQFSDVLAAGGYIFAVTGQNLSVLTFDGSNFTVKTTVSTSNGNRLYYANGMLFVPSNASSATIYVYKFDGTNLSQFASYGLDNTPSQSYFDGTYYYTLDGYGSIYAFSLSGSTFTRLAKSNFGYSDAYTLTGDGTNIMVGSTGTDANNNNSSVWLFRFDGSNFTQVSTYYTGAHYANSIYRNGFYYFSGQVVNDVFSITGNTIVYRDAYPVTTYYGRNRSTIDANFYYVADGNRAAEAFPLCNSN